METVIKEAKSVNGLLQLLDDKIMIIRKGFSTPYRWGDKTIMIKNISAIQFVKAGALTSGYMQFSFSGGKESKGGLWNAAMD